MGSPLRRTFDPRLTRQFVLPVISRSASRDFVTPPPVLFRHPAARAVSPPAFRPV
jgi:hypothetical protein